ncbi:hypothetical protein ACSVH5_03410 [Flavobacterium sp. RSSA_27]|uniref:hypothetical protein n=1 Tax=Flavobacterium sp. RSSA_27 TaxID=3447667 RepID=UPI003F3E149F
MQKIQFLFFLGCTFFFTQTTWAQFNNGFGNNGRMSQMNQMNAGPSQQSAPKPPSNEETASRVMESLKEEMNLDALQEIAIKNILVQSLNAQGVILKKESSNESKSEDIKVISENTDRKILELLNPDQQELYKKIIAGGFKKKKKK